MMTITLLSLDAPPAAAVAHTLAMTTATSAFIALHPDTEGAKVIGSVLSLDYSNNKADYKPAFLAHCLTHFFPGDADASALAQAWDSSAEWHRHARECWVVAHPGEALKDAIRQLSWLVLHCRWSANTEFAVWQVAILGQPPAVFQGVLAKANGIWLNGNPESKESQALIAEVKRLHQLAGGWWWHPGVDADGPVFIPTAQWEQVYARTLHDPDRGCDVISFRPDGTKVVYRGREGVGKWLDDNPEIADAFAGANDEEVTP